jgi:hypothetical protein
MEKIKGKKDHFMIKVSQTEIEIRRIDENSYSEINNMVSKIMGSIKSDQPKYLWQYYNKLNDEWDEIYVYNSGQYKQYSPENLELRYQREQKFKRILKTN